MIRAKHSYPEANVGSGQSAAEPPRSVDDPRVVELVEHYRASLEAGDKPDRQVLLDQFPQLAEELSACLDGLEFVTRVAPQLIDESPGDKHPSPAAWKAARTLGDFRILSEIGRGGMGVVYEAKQISLDRQVALKVLPFAAVLDPRQLKRFHTEATAAAGLHHPNIVPVYSVGCERSVHFYAMQYVEGATLAEVIRQLRRREGLEEAAPDDGDETGRRLADDVTSALGRPSRGDSERRDRTDAYPLPASRQTEVELDGQLPAAVSTEESTKIRAYFRRIAELCAQVAEALDYAHQEGVVHRDVKPSNLILDQHGKVWVTDFGLAHVGTDPGLTLTGDLLGTLRYMSPEQALAKRVVIDHRSDIYSLGVTLYELLTLRPAFAGNDRQELLRQVAFEEPRRLRHWNKNIPQELETIVLKATVKNPAGRYSTAQELADDLRRFLEDKPIQAKRPTLVDRVTKWSRRHVTLVWSAVIILGLATVGSVFGTLRIENQRQIATAQYEEAKRQKRAAELARANADRNLYVAQMRLAPNALKRGQVVKLHDALDDHLPQPDAADRRGWEWYYYLSQCHQELMTLYGHTDIVESVSWSPTGDRLATASRDGTIKVWDTASGQVIHTLSFSGEYVFSVDWSPDGQRLVSGGLFGEIVIWDLATGKPIKTWHDGNAWITDVAWSPDGIYLASTSMHHGARVWHADSGMLVSKLPGMSTDGLVSAPNAVAWSYDGRQLASGSHGEGMILLQIWDVPGHREPLELARSAYSLEAIAWSREGNCLAAAFANVFGIRLWDVQTGKQIHELPGHVGHTKSLAWSPDGKFLASAGTDHTVKIWNRESTQEMKTLLGHIASVSTVSWSPSGKRLATAGADFTVKIWDASSQQKPIEFEEVHNQPIRSLAWSPDGRRLASGSDDNLIKIWNPDSGQAAITLRHSGGEGIPWRPDRKGLAWSVDGKLLATGGDDNSVRLWDTTSGSEAQRLLGHTAPVGCIRWSPDGMTLASLAYDETIIIWDPHAGQKLRTISQPTPQYAPNLSWDVVSNRLASGTWQQLTVWDPTTGERIDSFQMSSNRTFDYPVVTAGWSLDGTRLAAFSANSLWISDASKGKPSVFLRGHSGPIFSASWSPDGRRLASTSINEAIIWDATTGQQLVSLDELSGKGMFIAWCPDGKRLALGGSDGCVAILDARTGFEFAESPEYALDRAHRLAATDRRQEAIDVLRKLADEHPDDPRFASAVVQQQAQAHVDEANYLIAVDRNDEAIDLLQQLADELPDNRFVHQRAAAAYFRIADAAFHDSDYDMALEILHKSIRLDPTRSQAYDHRGWVHLSQGELDKAIADFDQAIRYGAAYGANTHDGRAVAYLLKQRFEEANEDFTMAVELAREPVRWHQRALARLSAQNLQGYRDDCAAMLAEFGQPLAPADAFWVAWTCALAPDAVDDLTVPVALAEMAVESDPTDIRFASCLGAILYRAGRWEEAVEMLTQVDRSEKDSDQDVLFWSTCRQMFLATADYRLGNHQDAKLWLDRAVALTDKLHAEHGRSDVRQVWRQRLTLNLLRQEAGRLLETYEQRPAQSTSDS